MLSSSLLLKPINFTSIVAEHIVKLIVVNHLIHVVIFLRVACEITEKPSRHPHSLNETEATIWLIFLPLFDENTFRIVRIHMKKEDPFYCIHPLEKRLIVQICTMHIVWIGTIMEEFSS